jgi:hypothetical protein
MKALNAESRAPRMIVLENVCGALTSHDGRDFAAIGAARRPSIVSALSRTTQSTSSRNLGSEGRRPRPPALLKICASERAPFRYILGHAKIYWRAHPKGRND